MLDVEQFRQHIVIPTLERMEPQFQGRDAENLILGTMAQESGFRYLHQLNGPALGLIQMEPDTLDDLYENFLAYHKGWMLWLEGLRGVWPDRYGALTGNLFYQVAVCRFQYYRVQEPLPTDVEGYANYWKRYWNTEKGRGTRAQFILNYKEYING